MHGFKQCGWAGWNCGVVWKTVVLGVVTCLHSLSFSEGEENIWFDCYFSCTYGV